jgi:outer membrane protein assembly factor BamD
MGMMKHMRYRIRYLAAAALVLSISGCGQKGAKLQKSVVPPDKSLFETGGEYLGKSQYIKARLAFQTLINTYPDSELTADSYMAIGDSFYDEGGTENLLQAEDQYKNFIVFFPTHPKAADAQMKVIALNMKMMRAPDRDQQYAEKAEAAAKRMLEQFPDSPYAEVARQQLREIQENLAKSNALVGDYYFEKGKYRASKGRYQYVADHYPDYSELDEVHFRRAQSLEKTESSDEAAIYYQKIVQGYPFSKYFEEAKARLAELGKPVPAVDPALAAANQAKLKESPGFNVLRPVIAFTEALGFKGPPDPYQVAKKKVAEKAEAARTQAESGAGNGKPGEDTQLNVILKKDPSGKTQEETVVGPGAKEGEAADAKKDNPKNAKKKKRNKKGPK